MRGYFPNLYPEIDYFKFALCLTSKKMRKHHYLFLIATAYLVAALLPLLGQPYLQEPTIWKQYLRVPSFPYINVEEATYELKGDTVIDDKVYFKTLKTGIRYLVYN